MTVAQVLLGLSRRPLDAIDLTEAQRFITTESSAASLGLALLAAQDLRSRTTLPLRPDHQKSTVAPDSAREIQHSLRVLPPLPGVRTTDVVVHRLLEACLEQPLGLLPQVIAFLRARHLAVPASATPLVLGAMGLNADPSPDAISLLGARGARLHQVYFSTINRGFGTDAPADQLRLAFETDRARFRKTYASVFANALARATPENLDADSIACREGLAEVFAKSGWSLDVQHALQQALERGRLAALVSPSVLAKALYEPNGSLTPYSSYQLLNAASSTTYADAVGRATLALSEHRQQIQAEPLSITPTEFSNFALACTLVPAGATAAHLFESWALYGDEMQRRSPSLDLLLLALDASTFNRALQTFIDTNNVGLREPRLLGWIASVNHPLAPDLSTELVESQLRSGAYASTTLMREATLKLDSAVLEQLQGRGRTLAPGSLLARLERILRARDAVDLALTRAGASLGAR